MGVVFQVLNLLDRRQTVQDSEGLTPIAFAPGYLDSVGRAVWFTVRSLLSSRRNWGINLLHAESPSTSTPGKSDEKITQRRTK